MGHVYSTYRDPSSMPDPLNPQFDPNFGFETQRKKREMKVSMEEMKAAGLTPEQRGYCAHDLIIYKKCLAQSIFGKYKCSHEKHAWHECEREDHIMRMKEYERERRLIARQKRIDEKAKQEVMVE